MSLQAIVSLSLEGCTLDAQCGGVLSHNADHIIGVALRRFTFDVETQPNLAARAPGEFHQNRLRDLTDEWARARWIELDSRMETRWQMERGVGAGRPRFCR